MEKIVFDYNNFSEINYMNFDANFKISLNNKVKIILGPNGTGKTTIYKNIMKRFSDYSYIDYGSVEQSVIARKNTIIIGASILKLEELYKEKEDLIKEINIKDNLSKYNITNSETSKAVSRDLETLRKNHEEAIGKFNDDNLESIFELSFEDSNFLKENFDNIKSIEKVETNVEEIKKAYRKHILEEVNLYLSDDEKICPICGKENEESIKEIIRKELDAISEIKEEIVKNYLETFPDLKAEKVIEKVDDLIRRVKESNIEKNHLINFLICGGSTEKAQLIIKNKKKIDDINKQITELENRKEKFYNNLKEKKDYLFNIFEFQFDVLKDGIKYDEDNKSIEIKLPRKVEEYSTGEINLMTFSTCMLEFISSDKECLIIDDPLSSYDIPNQYRIIYEIAATGNQNKKILIFTHNINTINIANSQHNGLFSYEVLEKRKNTLFLNTINYTSSDNIISIENLLNQLDDSFQNKKYLKLLLEKDTWDDENPDEYENHLIFHYDEPFTKIIDGIEYNNDYFVDLINNLDDSIFCNSNYVENTANKIIYTAALRIWIEYQFYLLYPNDASLKEKQFGPKIKYMFEGDRWTGSSDVTKEYLMSKKVMLNQHIHQKSQEMPFYFALNLSLQDIEKEIMDIKEHFNS